MQIRRSSKGPSSGISQRAFVRNVDEGPLLETSNLFESFRYSE